MTNHIQVRPKSSSRRPPEPVACLAVREAADTSDNQGGYIHENDERAPIVRLGVGTDGLRRRLPIDANDPVASARRHRAHPRTGAPGGIQRSGVRLFDLDVRDVQDEIVRFWTRRATRSSGQPTAGVSRDIRSAAICWGRERNFQVRFGTKDGERRAYFTETVATTICNVEIVGGQLMVTPTTVTVPGS